MSVYEFTVEIEGVQLEDQHLDALYGAGCGDALFGQTGDVQYADFARQAEDYAAAVGSAIRAIETGVPGARVARITRHAGPLAAAG